MAQRNWAPDVVELGDRIARLTVTQATLLSRYLADVHGIKSPSGVDITPPEPDVVLEDGKAIPTSFDAVLDAYDPARRVVLIQATRALLGLGLKEARDMVDAAPRTVRAQVTEAEAQEVKAKLEAVGGQVTVRPAA
jgi:large subunit ribosomal protein L7/L12